MGTRADFLLLSPPRRRPQTQLSLSGFPSPLAAVSPTPAAVSVTRPVCLLVCWSVSVSSSLSLGLLVCVLVCQSNSLLVSMSVILSVCVLLCQSVF